MGVSLFVRVLVCAYLVCMMFSIGMLVGGMPKPDKLRRRHERRLLARALLLQLVVLPLVAWGVLELFDAHGNTGKALLVLAVAPGGRLLPNMVRRAHGEIGLSAEISIWLAKLTAFVAPPALALLGRVHRVELHDLDIIAALLGLQLLPYVAGRTLRQHRAAWSQRIMRPLELTRGALIVAVLVVVLANGKLAMLHLMGDRAWLGALVFTAVSLGLGWLFGGREPSTRRTFLLAANSRDLALGMTLASLAFAGLPIELPVMGIWAFTFACNLVLCEILGRPHRADAQVLAPST